VAELDGGGVAALFAADADAQTGAGLAAPVDGQLHQGADALLVEHLEWVVLQDVVVGVERQELVLGVLAGEREGRLGQVVGAEREELGDLSQLAGAHAGAHDFDHGAEVEAQFDIVFLFDRLADLVYLQLDQPQFLGGADLRHHDLGVDFQLFLFSQRGGFQHRADLHRVDLREGQAQAQAGGCLIVISIRKHYPTCGVAFKRAYHSVMITFVTGSNRR